MKRCDRKSRRACKRKSREALPIPVYHPANVQAHFETTGPEIWADTDGKVDIFVAGVGTGGTVTGVGQYLKSQNKDVKVVAVEPETSPVLSKGTAGPHKIQGIGAGFVPEVLDTRIYDEVFPVANEDAFTTGKELAKAEGVLSRKFPPVQLYMLQSSLQNARKTKEKQSLPFFRTSGDRYYSTALFAD